MQSNSTDHFMDVGLCQYHTVNNVCESARAQIIVLCSLFTFEIPLINGTTAGLVQRPITECTQILVCLWGSRTWIWMVIGRRLIPSAAQATMSSFVLENIANSSFVYVLLANVYSPVAEVVIFMIMSLLLTWL